MTDNLGLSPELADEEKNRNALQSAESARSAASRTPVAPAPEQPYAPSATADVGTVERGEPETPYAPSGSMEDALKPDEPERAEPQEQPANPQPADPFAGPMGEDGRFSFYKLDESAFDGDDLGKTRAHNINDVLGELYVLGQASKQYGEIDEAFKEQTGMSLGTALARLDRDKYDIVGRYGAVDRSGEDNDREGWYKSIERAADAIYTQLGGKVETWSANGGKPSQHGIVVGDHRNVGLIRDEQDLDDYMEFAHARDEQVKQLQDKLTFLKQDSDRTWLGRMWFHIGSQKDTPYILSDRGAWDDREKGVGGWSLNELEKFVNSNAWKDLSNPEAQQKFANLSELISDQYEERRKERGLGIAFLDSFRGGVNQYIGVMPREAFNALARGYDMSVGSSYDKHSQQYENLKREFSAGSPMGTSAEDVDAAWDRVNGVSSFLGALLTTGGYMVESTVTMIPQFALHTLLTGGAGGIARLAKLGEQGTAALMRATQFASMAMLNGADVASQIAAERRARGDSSLGSLGELAIVGIPFSAMDYIGGAASGLRKMMGIQGAGLARGFLGNQIYTGKGWLRDYLRVAREIGKGMATEAVTEGYLQGGIMRLWNEAVHGSFNFISQGEADNDPAAAWMSMTEEALAASLSGAGEGIGSVKTLKQQRADFANAAPRVARAFGIVDPTTGKPLDIQGILDTINGKRDDASAILADKLHELNLAGMTGQLDVVDVSALGKLLVADASVTNVRAKVRGMEKAITALEGGGADVPNEMRAALDGHRAVLDALEKQREHYLKGLGSTAQSFYELTQRKIVSDRPMAENLRTDSEGREVYDAPEWAGIDKTKDGIRIDEVAETEKGRGRPEWDKEAGIAVWHWGEQDSTDSSHRIVIREIRDIKTGETHFEVENAYDDRKPPDRSNKFSTEDFGGDRNKALNAALQFANNLVFWQKVVSAEQSGLDEIAQAHIDANYPGRELVMYSSEKELLRIVEQKYGGRGNFDDATWQVLVDVVTGKRGDNGETVRTLDGRQISLVPRQNNRTVGELLATIDHETMHQDIGNMIERAIREQPKLLEELGINLKDKFWTAINPKTGADLGRDRVYERVRAAVLQADRDENGNLLPEERIKWLVSTAAGRAIIGAEEETLAIKAETVVGRSLNGERIVQWTHPKRAEKIRQLRQNNPELYAALGNMLGVKLGQNADALGGLSDQLVNDYIYGIRWGERKPPEAGSQTVQSSPNRSPEQVADYLNPTPEGNPGVHREDYATKEYASREEIDADLAKVIREEREAKKNSAAPEIVDRLGAEIRTLEARRKKWDEEHPEAPKPAEPKPADTKPEEPKPTPAPAKPEVGEKPATAKPKSNEEAVAAVAANGSFVPMPFTTRVSAMRGAKTVDVSQAIANYSNRRVVVVELNGVRVPFYLSTGQGLKANVSDGKWYPFFGIGSDGWINKGTEDAINDYYGSKELRAVAEWLDSNIGDIQSIGQGGANMVSFTEEGNQKFLDFVNRDLSPISAETARTKEGHDKKYSAIGRIVEKVRGADMSSFGVRNSGETGTGEAPAATREIPKGDGKARVPAEGKGKVSMKSPDRTESFDGTVAYVDLGDIVNDQTPGFDMAFQNRGQNDASRKEMANRIGMNPDADTLTDAGTMIDEGTPVVALVDGKYMVIAGNTRAWGLQNAHRLGKLGAYTERVRADAAKDGVDLSGMQNPVKVRLLSESYTHEDLEHIAEVSNRQSKNDLSDANRAADMAKKILSEKKLKGRGVSLMDLFSPGPNGQLDNAANRDFMLAAIAESGVTDLLDNDKDGRPVVPNKKAYKLVENALVAAVMFGNGRASEEVKTAVRKIIDGDGSTRRLAGGIVAVAPALVRAFEKSPAFSIRDEMGVALGAIVRAATKKQSLEEFLYGTELAPDEEEEAFKNRLKDDALSLSIARELEARGVGSRKGVSASAVASLLGEYAIRVYNPKTGFVQPTQEEVEGLLGTEVVKVTKETLWNKALEAVRKDESGLGLGGVRPRNGAGIRARNDDGSLKIASHERKQVLADAERKFGKKPLAQVPPRDRIQTVFVQGRKALGAVGVQPSAALAEANAEIVYRYDGDGKAFVLARLAAEYPGLDRQRYMFGSKEADEAAKKRERVALGRIARVSREADPRRFEGVVGDAEGLRRPIGARARNGEFSPQTPEFKAQLDAVVARYKGTPQWLKAPNGKDSILAATPDYGPLLWATVRTPNFKAWFGDWEADPANASKVVDANGEPLLMFHGTPGPEISAFANNRALHAGNRHGGYYFTPAQQIAQDYAKLEENEVGGDQDIEKLFERFSRKQANYNKAWEEVLGPETVARIKALAKDLAAKSKSSEYPQTAGEFLSSMRGKSNMGLSAYEAMEDVAKRGVFIGGNFAVEPEDIEHEYAIRLNADERARLNAIADEIRAKARDILARVRADFDASLNRAGTTMPVFLNIRNPLYLDTDQTRAAAVEEFGGEDKFEALENDRAQARVMQRYNRRLLEAGNHDGYFEPGKAPSEMYEIVVPHGYEANIKSIFNSGAFSASDSRVRARNGVTPAEDAAYMDAVSRGDMETAQRMVREAAKSRGYALVSAIEALLQAGVTINNLGEIVTSASIIKTSPMFEEDIVVDSSGKIEHKRAAAYRVSGGSIESKSFASLKDAIQYLQINGFGTPKATGFSSPVDEWPDVAQEGYALLSATATHRVASQVEDYFQNKKDTDTASGDPVYIRFGKLPKSGRSRNYAEGFDEPGVSVFTGLKLKDGSVFVIPQTSQQLGTLLHARAQGRPVFIATGEVNGKGSDGEPTLANARIIKAHEYTFVPPKLFVNGDSVKRADVTYDDAGNVIPLSERFDMANPDIRARNSVSVAAAGRLGITNEEAERMEREGYFPDEIFRRTRWYRGVKDNEWRYEMEPVQIGKWLTAFENSPVRVIGRKTWSISDIIGEDSPFLRAYPLARNITVEFKENKDGGEGELVGDRITVWGRKGQTLAEFAQDKGDNGLLNSLTHELQHWVQNQEGWPEGSSPGNFRSDRKSRRLRQAENERSQAFWNARRLAAQHGYDTSPDAVEDRARRGGDEAAVADMEALLPEQVETAAEEEPWVADLRERVGRYRQAVANVKRISDEEGYQTAWDKYARVAGEVESRNAGSRAAMSSEEAAENPPWTTMDVAPQRQTIVRNGEVVAANARQPAGRQKQAGVAYPDASTEIKALNLSSLSGVRARNAEMEAILAKKRPDLDAKAVVNEIKKFKTPKEKKLALHWVVRGGLLLPQDAYKVNEALETVEQAKRDLGGARETIANAEKTLNAAMENIRLANESGDARKIARAEDRQRRAAARFNDAMALLDHSGGKSLEPFDYKSPDELLLALKEFSPSGRPIDPATVPELSDARDEGDGIVSYEVQDDRQGQAAMRRVIDTHWGEDANPWCLLAKKKKWTHVELTNDYDAYQEMERWWAQLPHAERVRIAGDRADEESVMDADPASQYYVDNVVDNPVSLDTAWTFWQQYSALPKRVAFKDGRLLAFMATEGVDQGNDWLASYYLEERYPERMTEYEAWLNTEEGREEQASFVDWMNMNHPDEVEYADKHPPEEWWDRQDESHPNLDWARDDASGVRARNIDETGAMRIGLGNADEAKRMERDGASRLDIWRKTGWWRGSRDGKWRIELPPLQFKPGAFEALNASIHANQHKLKGSKYTQKSLPTYEDWRRALESGGNDDQYTAPAAKIVSALFETVAVWSAVEIHKAETGGTQASGPHRSWFYDDTRRDKYGAMPREDYETVVAAIKEWKAQHPEQARILQEAERPRVSSYDWGNIVERARELIYNMKHGAAAPRELQGKLRMLWADIAAEENRVKRPETLRELLSEDDPVLKAYPELADFPIVFQSDTGRYGGWAGDGKITLNTIWTNDNNTAFGGEFETRKTLAHEIQHEIQRIAGLGRGISPDTIKRARKLGKPIEGDNAALSPDEVYMGWGGEVEAREVEARMRLTDEQRKEIPPWVTEEVVREDKFGKRTDYSYAAQKRAMEEMGWIDEASRNDPNGPQYYPLSGEAVKPEQRQLGNPEQLTFDFIPPPGVRARNGEGFYADELFPLGKDERGNPLIAFRQVDILRRMRALVPGYDYKPEHIEERQYIEKGLEILNSKPGVVDDILRKLENNDRPPPLSPDEQYVLYTMQYDAEKVLEKAIDIRRKIEKAGLTKTIPGQYQAALAWEDAAEQNAIKYAIYANRVGSALGRALAFRQVVYKWNKMLTYEGVVRAFNRALADAAKRNGGAGIVGLVNDNAIGRLTDEDREFVKQFFAKVMEAQREYEKAKSLAEAGAAMKNLTAYLRGVDRMLRDLQRKKRNLGRQTAGAKPLPSWDALRTDLLRKADETYGLVASAEGWDKRNRIEWKRADNIIKLIGNWIIANDIAQGKPQRSAPEFQKELFERCDEILGRYISLTAREYSDEFSDYGLVREASKNEMFVRRTKLNGALRLLAQIEDVRKGEAPRRTGQQRVEGTDEQTELERQLHALIKELDPEAEHALNRHGEPDEKFIKTPLQIWRDAAEKEIRMLKAAIESGVPIERNALPLRLGEEELALKDILARRRQEYRELFVLPKTEKERTEAYLRQLVNREAALQTELENARKGNFTHRTDANANIKKDSRVQAIMAEMKAIREEIQSEKDRQGDINSTHEKRVRAIQRGVELLRKNVDRWMADPNTYFEERRRRDARREEIENDPRVKAAREEQKRLVAELEAKTAAFAFKRMNALGKSVAVAGGIRDAIKVFLASGDISGVGVQCALAALDDPAAAIKAIKAGLGALLGGKPTLGMTAEEWANKKFDELVAKNPFLREAIDEYGIHLSALDTKGVHDRTEEGFARSHVTERAKAFMERRGGVVGRALGGYVDRSERAFNLPVDILRLALCERLAKYATERNGKELSAAEKKYIGRLVNAATGRGDFFGHAGFSATLSRFFWAPARFSGQLQMLALPFTLLAHSDVSGAVKLAIARKFMLRTAVNYGIACMLAYLLKSLVGDDGDDEEPLIETDPRSAKFGRINIGGRMFSLTGGLESYVTLGARLFTGETKTKNGDVMKVGQMGESRTGLIWRMMENKLTPDLGMLRQFINKRTTTGEKIEGFFGKNGYLSVVTGNTVFPLTVKDMTDVLTDARANVAEKFFLAGITILGYNSTDFGYNDYDAVSHRFDRAHKALKDAKTAEERQRVMESELGPYAALDSQGEALRHERRQIDTALRTERDPNRRAALLARKDRNEIRFLALWREGLREEADSWTPDMDEALKRASREIDRMPEVDNAPRPVNYW